MVLMLLGAHSAKFLKTHKGPNDCNYSQACCATIHSRDLCYNDWTCNWNKYTGGCQRASLTESECAVWGKDWVNFYFLFQDQCSRDPGCTFNGPEPHGTCMLGCNYKNFSFTDEVAQCCARITQAWSCRNRGNYANCGFAHDRCSYYARGP